MDRLHKALTDTKELLELAASENDEESFGALVIDLNNLAAEIEELEFHRMFSGEMDANNAYLDVQAGSGGTEAQDWAIEYSSAGPVAAAHKVPAAIAVMLTDEQTTVAPILGAILWVIGCNDGYHDRHTHLWLRHSLLALLRQRRAGPADAPRRVQALSGGAGRRVRWVGETRVQRLPLAGLRAPPPSRRLRDPEDDEGAVWGSFRRLQLSDDRHPYRRSPGLGEDSRDAARGGDQRDHVHPSRARTPSRRGAGPPRLIRAPFVGPSQSSGRWVRDCAQADRLEGHVAAL